MLNCVILSPNDAHIAVVTLSPEEISPPLSGDDPQGAGARGDIL